LKKSIPPRKSFRRQCRLLTTAYCLQPIRNIRRRYAAFYSKWSRKQNLKRTKKILLFQSKGKVKCHEFITAFTCATLVHFQN